MSETDFDWTPPEELLPGPERVIWHWTAGTREATLGELQRYHILVEHHAGDPGNPDDDRIVIRSGVPLKRNMRSLRGLPGYHNDSDRGYAAHTKGFNSRSIGIALCGMHGAKDFRPTGGVAPGPYPITMLQTRALLALSVQAARMYGLPPRPETFFSHYEAEFLHGVDQLPPGDEIYKWNITWLPGMNLAREEAGPWLRNQLKRWLAGQDIDDCLYTPPPGESSADAVRGQEG